MKLVTASFALVEPPLPIQFVLLAAESDVADEAAWFETITPPGYEGWRRVVQGRVDELAPNAQTIREIVAAVNVNNALCWGPVREFEVVADAIATAYALVGKEPGHARVNG